MKKLFLLSALLSLGFLSFAQTTFKKDFDGGYLDSDEAHSMIQTTDGSYMMTGAIWVDDEAWYDIGLIKVDELGNELWKKTYGAGSFNIELGNAVVQTDDGGYWIAGSTDGYSGTDDFWAIRTDENGDTLWTKVYGGDNQDFASGGIQTSDGGFIITGSTNSFGAGGDDVYVVKTDSNGIELWSKTYGTDEMDYGNDIQECDDGGYIIAGAVNGYQDGFLIRTDVNGDTLWTRIFGGPLTDEFFSVKQTDDGGFIIAGKNMSEGAGDYDIWLMKTDANGQEEWSKYYGGEKKDQGFSVSITGDGNYFIVGYTESFAHGDEDSDMYWIKTDENGDTLWTRSFGDMSDDGGLAGIETDDGGLAATGYFYHSGEMLNFYLVKMTGDGTVGIAGIKDEQSVLMVFPNPVTSTATVQFPNPKQTAYQLKVKNINGQTVRETHQIRGNQVIFEKGDLPKGIYFIELSGEQTYKGKIIIE
jgi:hypothetical protein